MAVWSETVMLIRRDVARWVRPEQVAELHEVTPSVVLRLVFRHPPLRAMVLFRLGAAAHALGVRGVPSFVQRRMLIRYGIEIAPSTQVGGGLYLPHPVGCVLHARSIGENVSVIGNVTFGTRTDGQWPTIGDRVFVGVGARVLGGITVGAGAAIGANAVVVHDVPPGAVAVGVPARTRGARTVETSSLP
jgi:serine O-acetyltransferase